MTSFPPPGAADIRAHPLSGCRILVVEDEWIIAEDIASALEEAGAAVLGPFPNMIDALDHLSDLGAIDGAVLDIGLGDQQSYPLADALRTTKVPFLFLTGVQRTDLPRRFARTPHLLKPFTAHRLVETLLRMDVHHG